VQSQNIPAEKLYSVLSGEVTMFKKEKYHIEFFVFISHSKTTHIASFLLSDRYFSAPKISFLSLTVSLLDNYLVLHARCNCRPFVFIVL